MLFRSGRYASPALAAASYPFVDLSAGNHSEAYAAGELKHGTISLIEDGTLVIGVLTQFELYEKTISNMVDKPRNLAKSVTGIGVCPHKCRVKFLKVF